MGSRTWTIRISDLQQQNSRQTGQGTSQGRPMSWRRSRIPLCRSRAIRRGSMAAISEEPGQASVSNPVVSRPDPKPASPHVRMRLPTQSNLVGWVPPTNQVTTRYRRPGWWAMPILRPASRPRSGPGGCSTGGSLLRTTAAIRGLELTAIVARSDGEEGKADLPRTVHLLQ